MQNQDQSHNLHTMEVLRRYSVESTVEPSSLFYVLLYLDLHVLGDDT